MIKRKVISCVCLAALLFTTIFSGLNVKVFAKPTLPSGATIGETDEKLEMKPGDIDWVIGSPYTSFSKTPPPHYTDYAKAWAKNAQSGGADKTNTHPHEYIYAADVNIGARNGDYYYGAFMGYPVYNAYYNTAPWCNGGMIYKIQSGSYVAVALLIEKSKVGTILPSEFLFATSVDGNTWTDITPDIQLEFDANDPIQTVGKAPTRTVYKATLKMPDDATMLRITMPGGGAGENSTWPGKDYGYTDALLGTLVVSVDNLAEHNTLSTVEEFKEPVLTPGTFDDLSEDYFYNLYIRGTWSDANDYNWNTPERIASCIKIMSAEVEEPEYPNFYGKLMGQNIPYSIKSDMGWNGSSVIYNVVEKTYIATALLTTSNKSIDCFEHFAYEISADGITWQPVEHTITQTSEHEGDEGFDAYKAVVYIPEGMSYYRITLPGYNREATNGNEYTWALRDTECVSGFRIGCSTASAYNLNDYELLVDVPDSPFYVDKKADLKNIIIISQAVTLSKYENGDEKEEFEAALADAISVRDDSEATQEEIDAATDRLTAAKEALVPKEIPDYANIEPDEERRILKPGIYDDLSGSVFMDNEGKPLTATDGRDNWYCNYTDYGLGRLVSHYENRYLTPEKFIHATSYDFFLLDTLLKFNFMGKNIEQVYMNTGSWAGCNVSYKVYAGSFIASAILVNNDSPSSEEYPDIQNDYVFQVSADDENWEDITATISKLHTEGKFDLYKAVVQIPEGKYYYRIVMPKAEEISSEAKFYQGSPSYLNTFLGPTVASMDDLNEIDDYADVTDATEWYVDAVLTSKDATKVSITESYFKCLKDGMTVADALAALDTTKAQVAFYTADGTKITDTTTEVVAGMKVDILDIKGISLNQALGIPMLTVAAGTDLLSIASIDPVEVTCGAPKTAEGLNLPETVSIEAGHGSFDATIDWDVAGCDYDPDVTTEQKFTVNGTVILPEGVTNDGNVDLNVSIEVTVLASDEMTFESIDVSKVKIDHENGIVYVKEGLTLAEINDLLKPVGEVFIAFGAEDGSEITDLDIAAQKGMTVDLFAGIGLINSYDIDFLENDDVPGTGDNVGMVTLLMLTIAAFILIIKRRQNHDYTV